MHATHRLFTLQSVRGLANNLHVVTFLPDFHHLFNVRDHPSTALCLTARSSFFRRYSTRTPTYLCHGSVRAPSPLRTRPPHIIACTVGWLTSSFSRTHLPAHMLIFMPLSSVDFHRHILTHVCHSLHLAGDVRFFVPSCVMRLRPSIDLSHTHRYIETYTRVLPSSSPTWTH